VGLIPLMGGGERLTLFLSLLNLKREVLNYDVL
jgi:hypothetical protein